MPNAPFRWAFTLSFVMLIIVAGFWKLSFVGVDDPLFDAFRNLESTVEQFDEGIDAQRSIQIDEGNVFDPAGLVTQAANVMFTGFGLFINGIALIALLPLNVLTVVNAFAGVPTEIRTIIGVAVSFIAIFGMMFFIGVITQFLRR